ncbi:uncharacterized protein L969DRAFT_14275 [Mixia osmundae IAM 14324]|uniref:uncharacterized protein n=1 Tax=Mixia osmundae (strain CBS 9802 / IAM 14324 / JCM 22182 / KY 12970) TaxID=764103 RepID=UPI0004A54EA3|nr:uncharacterized protein L969DRAFT_14275 [Mixia osmundae IAM 14324]KEI42068.1 hypothetical protein L969DRAFT_14275 [Mixia osmundae IAM 14324]
MSSRADVSAPITTSDLKVFYCACGELGLVINRSLASLARRPVDNAMILRNTGKDKMYYKLNALLDREPIVYKRPDGLEKQWRLRCQRCDLQLGYETSDAREASTRGPYTYLLHARRCQALR